jgi:hypothetical protein
VVENKVGADDIHGIGVGVQKLLKVVLSRSW